MRNVTEVASVPQFLAAIDAVHAGLPGQAWWRGQSCAVWDLVPKVFRDDQRGRRYETNIALKFVQKAQTRHPRCPDPSNRYEWLFLMQHFGLPTRLLDWSESPLIAGYFAVDDAAHQDEDGAVWALDAFKMGEVLSDKRGLSDPRHPRVRTLIDKVFEGGDSNDDYAVAIVSAEVDPRMMAQQAAVMVHGSPKPLNDYVEMAPLLCKIVIKSKAKADLQSWLARIGIRERSVFPDLVHLAADLASDRYAP